MLAEQCHRQPTPTSRSDRDAAPASARTPSLDGPSADHRPFARNSADLPLSRTLARAV